ncbi:sugar ABC transporter ATP-binding protein [bacterium]|nr:sugar ABC transporter ATP-binding protein [bacterium]
MGTRPVGDVSLDEIVRMMVGRDLSDVQPRVERTLGAEALRVEGLCRGQAVRDVSFAVREGEVLGLAGLMGSGRTETLRAIFGADRRDAGDVFLNDAPVAARIRSPRDAVRQGIALLTEDRKEQGLLLPLAVRVNATLARLGAVARFGQWIDPARERTAAERLVDALGVRCHSAEQPVATLSGGNQQKVVLARWLFRDCRVLLFDEPTRGVDVGAKFEIYRLLGELSEQGKAVVVASSDLLELFAICDRIAVLSAGRLAATFRRGEWSEDLIMQAALSEHMGAATA